VGVLATDAAERFGIPLKFAPEDVQAELKKYMPEFGSAKNPADLTGVASAEWYESSVRNSIQHPWVDGLAVLYCEVAITDPLDVAKSIKKAVDDSGVNDKPVTVSFIGGEETETAMQWLVENGIPAYPTPDAAVNAIAALYEYDNMKEVINIPETICVSEKGDIAREIIHSARSQGRSVLTEIESKQVFALYDLPITKSFLATNEDEAVEYAREIGYPVVMKIVSPDILHKSDARGVRVNIRSDEDARDAFIIITTNALRYKPDADIHGVVVQEMAPWGTEVILGSVNDPTFWIGWHFCRGAERCHIPGYPCFAHPGQADDG
jgi:acetyltransferase